MKHFFRIFLILIMPLAGFSQFSQDFSLQRFQTQNQHIDFNTGRKGVQFRFDLVFPFYDDDFFLRSSYEMFFRLETWDGKVVFDSPEQTQSLDQKVPLHPIKPISDQQANYMVAYQAKIFIPWSAIELETGTHELNLVLSLESKARSFPDIITKNVTLEQQKVVTHPFSEQEFAISPLAFTYDQKGYGTKWPGLKIDFGFAIKYGPNQTPSRKYKLTWGMYNLRGQPVFESEQASSPYHRETQLILRDLKNNQDSLSLFAAYPDVELGGPEECEVRIWVEADNGEKRLIHSSRELVDYPVKYLFEDQKFEVSEVNVRPSASDGVAGTEFTFFVNFAETGPRSDPGRGAYHFFVSLKDSEGNEIFNPQSGDLPPKGTTVAFFPVDPAQFPEGSRLRIFIPQRLYEASPGQTNLIWSLRVTDRERLVAFPELTSGKISVQELTRKNLRVEVQALNVIKSNYDPLSSLTDNRRPDLQWRLQLGRDEFARSPVNKRSREGLPGKGSVTMVDGDEVFIEIYDADKGMFNRDDLLERFQLPVPESGESEREIVLEEEGYVEYLRVKLVWE